MNRKWRRILAGTCVLMMSALWTAPARAQMTESKEKPPMYTYIGNWNIPRAQWAAWKSQTRMAG